MHNTFSNTMINVETSRLNSHIYDCKDENNYNNDILYLSLDYWNKYFFSNLKSIQPLPQNTLKTKKRVRFSSKCKVKLICNRNDLSDFSSEIWYTKREYKHFRKEGVSDIMKLKKKFGFSTKESTLLLGLYRRKPIASSKLILENTHAVETTIPIIASKFPKHRIRNFI